MNAPAPESSEITSNGHVFVKTTYLGISVLIDKETGFYSGTKICKDNGKKFGNISRLEDYKLMLEAVSEQAQIRACDLVHVFSDEDGFNNETRGTYVHPLLVNYIAQWANKKYAVKIAMLLNVLNERLLLQNKTLEREIEGEKYLVGQLKDENSNLEKEIQDLKNQLQESRSEIDFLVNKAITSEYALDELRENDRQIIDKILDVNREVGSIPVKLKRMGKVHNILSIYTSATKPVNPVARNRAHEGEIWLGTYVGQEINKRRSVPADFEEIYSSDFNGLDSFTDVLQNETLSPFILKTHQRSILVSEEHLEEFINTLNAYLNQTGNYNSVVNLGETLRRIQNRNRKAAFVEKKREILAQFPNLHIRINNWNRKVYIRIDGELVAPTAETAELSWFYRYGKDGAYKAEINEKMIENFAFANKGDSRIKYE